MRVQGLGLRVEGLGFWFEVQGLGFRVEEFLTIGAPYWQIIWGLEEVLGEFSLVMASPYVGRCLQFRFRCLGEP